MLRIWLLSKTKSEAVIPELISLVEDEDSDVRSIVVYALGEIKSEIAISELIKLLEHENSDLRYSAADTLKEIKPFPVALLRGGKGLPAAGYESVKAEENIRNISNQVQDGVGIIGDRNVGLNIGTAGNITIGDISSK